MPLIDSETQLKWNRKVSAPSSSVSAIKGKGVGATAAASGVTRAPRATAVAANANGSSLGAIEPEHPSGKPLV